MLSLPVPSSLSHAQLRSVFTNEGRAELVGLEVETAALDPVTGAGIPYHGDRGIGAFLRAIIDATGGEPEYDQQFLVGLRWPDGGQISLEHGGAVEYSSPPMASIVDLVDLTRRTLRRLAAIAGDLGFVLLLGANYPFTSFEDVQWMPLARGPIMRRYFASLGETGEFGPRIMSMALSTQVTFDYTTPSDLAEKLRVQVAAATPAAALFVNSPLEAGRPCGALSRRMQYWGRADPERTRILPLSLDPEFTIDRFIGWALGMRMIHRRKPDGTRASVPAQPFSDLLTAGFGDGTHPGLPDWSAHLSQIFPDIRLRSTLEVRGMDGPPYTAFAAVPAFWTGLTYHPPSRAAAWELMRGFSHADHYAALDDIARRGMAAELGGQPVREFAAELLRLSELGLRHRIEAAQEKEEALAYLSPLQEIVATGQTFSERTLVSWEREFGRSPQRYLEAFRIPSSCG